MIEWDRAARYKKLSEITEAEFETLQLKTDQSPWRQAFHIQPISGLLNDPNGFCYYNGEYHLFYQWFPLGPVHGLKHWYHTTSTDLATFQNKGIAVTPDTKWDSHGAYSGSGIVVNGQFYIVYTGNHRTEAWDRVPYQVIAQIENGEAINKTMIIDGPHEGYTDHYRDPKVWFENGLYYMVLGAQRTNETGTIVVYTSTDFKEWTFKGELNTTYDDFGYMWECPDVFSLNNQDVVLFCPQGLDPVDGKYQNIYQSGYLIGHIDKSTLEMTHGEFHELDHGFDFYAPQTTLDKDGNRILVGWMGLPDTDYPTDEYGWAHCLTLPRVLTIEEGKLRQRPVPSLQKLRRNEETALGYATRKNVKLHPYEGKAYELLVDILENEAPEFYLELKVSRKESTLLTYNKAERRLTLERFDSGRVSQEVVGTSRSIVLEKDLSQLQIFVDHSSIEIFINDGEAVMTTRIFASEDATGIRTSTANGQVYLKFTKYDLIGE